jgi:hypothetical protein
LELNVAAAPRPQAQHPDVVWEHQEVTVPGGCGRRQIPGGSRSHVTTLPAGFAKQTVVAIVDILLTNPILKRKSFVTKPTFHGAGTTMRDSMCSSKLKRASNRQATVTVTILMNIQNVLVQILLPLETPRA